jgi:dihydrofolate synthase / folylpolyglutamate synthase
VTIRDDLLSLEQFGIKLGLDNIRMICRELGDPQRACATVVVGGTNGKGSVTAMVAEACRAARLRSGRYTSPHLVRLEERFVVDGREVSSAQVDAAAGKVLDATSRLLASGQLHAPPTFFEATTAIALEVFRDAALDIAVLEVGLGGRLDATNIAEPLAVGITSIDRDHEAQLGDTLEAIAFEKAGIIKTGTPVVIGPLAAGPREVIARVADERGAPLVDALAGVVVEADMHHGEARVRLTTPRRRYPPIALGLRGRHQVTNAVVAVRLLETLEGHGLVIGADAIVRGLTQVRWPGRLEWIDTPSGRLLLDAAHNPAGARSLAAYLSETQPRAVPLVFGAVRDKDVPSMVRALMPVVSRLITTQASTPRAADAEDLARIVRAAAPSLPVMSCRDPITAVSGALAADGIACCAGSIFLIGEVRSQWVGSGE